MNMQLEKKIRRWFCNGNQLHSGLTLLTDIGVDKKIISMLDSSKEKNPSGVNLLIEKILLSIDPIDLVITFDFNSLDLSSLEVAEASISPLDVPLSDTNLQSPVSTDLNVNNDKGVVITPVDVPGISDTMTDQEKEKDKLAISSVFDEINKEASTKDEPLEIKELREKAKMLHKQHAYLSFELGVAKTNKGRYKIAAEIMEDVLPKLDNIYDTIRHWQKTGTIPPLLGKDEFKKGVETILRKESLRTRIAKLNRLLKEKLPVLKKREYEKELLDKQIEFEKINQLLQTL